MFEKMKKRFKSMPPKMRILIVGALAICLIMIFAGVLNSSKNSMEEASEKLSDAIETQQEKTPPSPLPSSDYNNQEAQNTGMFDPNAIENAKRESSLLQENENADSLDVVQNSNEEYNVLLPKRETRQKPSDMIVYLKGIKEEISFIEPRSKTFEYEKKTWNKGEKFNGWYTIENVNNVYIRFYDDEKKYSYNLRFIEE